MAVTLTPKSVAVTLKVNNGTTTSGALRTASISIGRMHPEHFDAQKACNIVNTLAACLDRSAHAIEKAEVDEISEE